MSFVHWSGANFFLSTFFKQLVSRLLQVDSQQFKSELNISPRHYTILREML